MLSGTAGGLMARLVIYSSGTVNQTLELTGQNVRIGRAKENDVVLRTRAGRLAVSRRTPVRGRPLHPPRSEQRQRHLGLGPPDPAHGPRLGYGRRNRQLPPGPRNRPRSDDGAADFAPFDSPEAHRASEAVSGTLVASLLPDSPGQRPPPTSVPLPPPGRTSARAGCRAGAARCRRRRASRTIRCRLREGVPAGG